MTDKNPFAFIARFLRKAKELGFKEAARQGFLRLLTDPYESAPLSRANKAGLLADDVAALHEQEKNQIRASSLLLEASQVEASYPHVFEHGGRAMRYAFLPASESSQGLAVLFHGHNAFLHMGPLRPWRHFDVLAPWDTFGFQRQGSWFWGEGGEPFVEEIVQALIASKRAAAPGAPWFCIGGSMGGFGALWHGVKFGCGGIYAMCPQVDLAAKIKDYEGDGHGNPYAALAGAAAGPPDILAEAAGKETLPPLFLVQNQYDHVNPFASHAWKLIEIYNAKKGWYGLRVNPSIGHGGDGKQEEAELFFRQIIEKKPSHRTDF